jgi:hypothetical protein
VVGDEEPASARDEERDPAEQERGSGNATPDLPVNEEIAKKKIDRHGDVGGEA